MPDTTLIMWASSLVRSTIMFSRSKAIVLANHIHLSNLIITPSLSLVCIEVFARWWPCYNVKKSTVTVKLSYSQDIFRRLISVELSSVLITLWMAFSAEDLNIQHTQTHWRSCIHVLMCVFDYLEHFFIWHVVWNPGSVGRLFLLGPHMRSEWIFSHKLTSEN